MIYYVYLPFAKLRTSDLSHIIKKRFAEIIQETKKSDICHIYTQSWEFYVTVHFLAIFLPKLNALNIHR